MEFEVGPSQQDPRKVVGVWVRAVPRGTSRGLAVLQDGLSGVVVRELSGQQRRPQVSPWSLQLCRGSVWEGVERPCGAWVQDNTSGML